MMKRVTWFAGGLAAGIAGAGYAKKKVKESEERMNTLEKACIQREYLIGGFLCDREWRDYWNIDTYVFTTGRTLL